MSSLSHMWCCKSRFSGARSDCRLRVATCNRSMMLLLLHIRFRNAESFRELQPSDSVFVSCHKILDAFPNALHSGRVNEFGSSPVAGAALINPWTHFRLPAAIESDKCLCSYGFGWENGKAGKCVH